MSYGHILKLPIIEWTYIQKLQSFQFTSFYYENKLERETNLGSWVNEESHCVAHPFETAPPN